MISSDGWGFLLGLLLTLATIGVIAIIALVVWLLFNIDVTWSLK